MSPEDLTEVVRLAHERGIWVISDECYVYLNYTGKLFSVGALRDFRERMVIVGSLSKTYAMTGWRLGYALAPAAGRQRNAEVAESVHVESHFHRSEGSRGRAGRVATVCRRHAAPSTSSCAIMW